MSLEKKIKWAVFFSGWGRSANDFLTLLKDEPYCASHKLVCLITAGQKHTFLKNTEDIEIKVIDKELSSFQSKTHYQHWLSNYLNRNSIDYIFLLGYKFKISHPLLNTFGNRIFNTHPSLLPSFKNTQTAIQDALKYGVKISRITSHIIDQNIDEGIIICQESIIFAEYNSLETLDPKFNLVGIEILKKTLLFLEQNHQENKYLSNKFCE